MLNGFLDPPQAILENACLQGFTDLLNKSVSIMTNCCYDVMVMADGLRASDQKELLYR